MHQAHVIYGCGCVVVQPFQDTRVEMTVPLMSPNKETFDLRVLKLMEAPLTYIEAQQERPEWAEGFHHLVPFDLARFPEANVEKFQHLFMPLAEKFGAVIPACWLPELIGGRGKFYGFWKHQVTPQGRRYGHLQVVEAPVSGEKTGTTSAENEDTNANVSTVPSETPDPTT